MKDNAKNWIIGIIVVLIAGVLSWFLVHGDSNDSLSARMAKARAGKAKKAKARRATESQTETSND